MRSFASLASIAAASAAFTKVSAVNALSVENSDVLFQQFVQDFDRVYETEADRATRFQIFQDNIARFVQLNNNNSGVTFGINEFADLTDAEASKARSLGFVLPEGIDGASLVPGHAVLRADNPKSVDHSGCYTTVRDQGQCGSCWAFAATGVLEGQECLVNNVKVDLAPQTLVDCDKKDGGCQGGMLDTPLDYIVRNGICAESEYAYTANDRSWFIFKNKCKANQCTTLHKLDSFKQIGNDAQSLIDALQNGPLSIAVGVTSEFQRYQSGVMNKESCGETRLNHAVVLVGYEIDENDEVTFKVRNSWGGRWGDNGYIRLTFGACGLGSMNFAGSIDKKTIRM